MKTLVEAAAAPKKDSDQTSPENGEGTTPGETTTTPVPPADSTQPTDPVAPTPDPGV